MARGNVLITGNSSGLGKGLTQWYLEQGNRVYGCSRRGSELQSESLRDIRCDLSDLEAIPKALDELLGDAEGLELAVLNAGLLGEVKDLSDTGMDEIRRVMDVNVWANKIIMDWLLRWRKPIRQLIMISSGASQLGSRGMGVYAISKSALNMLAKLYAHEFPETHVTAVAPGLIDSAMMDYLCVEPDAQRYPALQRIRDARGTSAMPKPNDTAQRIVSVLPKLLELESGSYIDIRDLGEFGEPVPQRKQTIDVSS